MAVLPILEYSSRLQHPSVAVEPAELGSDWLRTLVADMIQTMRVANGIGLAAPQVGVFKRIAVIEITEEKQQGATKQPVTDRWVLINPEIEETNGTQMGNEGCLSMPGARCPILRPGEVVVRFQDEHGEWHRIVGERLLASALMHEVDHLDGKLFWQRAAPVKRDIMRRRWERFGRLKAREHDGKAAQLGPQRTRAR